MGRRKIISKETKEIAVKIQEELLDRGFIVHRCDDYLNRTIYIKVDYGIINTIRISEKPESGIKYPYKFNIRQDLKKFRIVEGNSNIRYYIPYSDYYKLFDIVDSIACEYLTRYGKDWYENEIKSRERECQYRATSGAFWNRAYQVFKNEVFR